MNACRHQTGPLWSTLCAVIGIAGIALSAVSGAASRPRAASATASARAAADVQFVFRSTDFGASDSASGVAIQPDGKIIACGSTGPDRLHGGRGHHIALARYDPDGNLDPTFGTGGKVVVDLGADTEVAADIVVLSDGRLLIAGRISADFLGSGDASDSDSLVARFNSNGALDTTFGTLGVAAVDLKSTDDSAKALVLQPDGAIIVAGSSYVGGQFGMALARFTAAGQLDPSFGMGGVALPELGMSLIAEDVAVDADGSLLVATKWEMAVARLSASGALDQAFGQNGIALVPSSRANGVMVRPDGTIVVAGTGVRDLAGYEDFLVAQFSRAGTLDEAFGDHGLAFMDVAGGTLDVLTGQAIDPAGRIFLAGHAADGTRFGTRWIGLALRRADGSPDAAFGSAGTGAARVAFPDGVEVWPGAAAVGLDGRGVVVGTYSVQDGDQRADDFMLALVSLPATPPKASPPSQATATATPIAPLATVSSTPDVTAVPTVNSNVTALAPNHRLWFPWVVKGVVDWAP